MSELLPLLVALAAGAALGALYFGGLWWTVRRLASLEHPNRLVLVSFLVRMALVLAGFYVVMQGQWQRLVACLVGFLVARTVVIRCWRPRLRPTAGS